MEIYKKHIIRKVDFGYYEAVSKNGVTTFNKNIKKLKQEIDEQI